MKTIIIYGAAVSLLIFSMLLSGCEEAHTDAITADDCVSQWTAYVQDCGEPCTVPEGGCKDKHDAVASKCPKPDCGR